MNVSLRLGVAASAACLLFGGNAFAGLLLDVQNSGFEDPVLADGLFSVDVPGWQVSTPVTAGAVNPQEGVFTGGIPEGDNLGFTVSGGWMSQILSDVLTPDTDYTLEVEISARPEFLAGIYEIGLYAGGQELAVDSNTITLTPGGEFQTATVTFAALETGLPVGDQLEIRLANIFDGGPPSTVMFDNVRLTASATPAPGALALPGLMGLSRRRRRS